MEELKTKAYDYAEKIGRQDTETVVHFMSGYQAAMHQNADKKLQEIKDNYRENGIEIPQDIIKDLDDLAERLAKF